MSNILDEIVRNKIFEQNALAKKFGCRFEKSLLERKCVSMSQALLESETGIIAEFKRRSPSKGDIHPMADVVDVVPGYEKMGAAAVSVLTDTRYFGGSTTDFVLARSLVKLPMIRKDFIVNDRQIYEAKAIGADAILLIAACTSPAVVRERTELSHSLGMEVLLEVHNEEELDCYYEGIDMVGINNRDLTTFRTDPLLSEKAIKFLPKDVVKIAESGLTNFEEVLRLRKIGFNGFLIGETFMKHANPPEALKEFISTR